jgi:hypothetical protein
MVPAAFSADLFLSLMPVPVYFIRRVKFSIRLCNLRARLSEPVVTSVSRAGDSSRISVVMVSTFGYTS